MAERLEDAKTRIPVHRNGHAHDEDMPPIIRKVKKTRALPKRSKEMRFVSLHHHSTFSYLDGFQLPEAHVRRAEEIMMRGIAMTEHGNVSSHVQLETAALKAGIKPIFGVELYCGNVGEGATQRKNHLTILAEDQPGYRNLLQLVTRTYSEGFYYEPTADGRMLEQHKDGLIVMSGCQGSLLFTSLVGGKHIAPEDASYERAKQVAARFKRSFGDSYYIEVQAFPELEETRKANPLLAQIAQELNIPLVATFDCHYTVPEEKEIQQVLHNIRPGEKQTLEDQVRSWGYSADLCPPWNDNMVLRKLIATGIPREQAIAAIVATEEIYDRCNVELPSLPMVRFPLPSGYESTLQVWNDWLEEGWRYRKLDERLGPRDRKKYRERLLHEKSVIEGKDFIDYFLIVSDAVRWAKDHDIAVGPARGSAAGSLACWLLRITEVNPMLYPDLVFERFIDVTRQDLPDIDLDFDSERRGEVRDYLIGKYGRERVSNVGTYGTFKGRMALDDAARVYKVPQWEVERVKDVLIERSSGDLRASATIEDTVMQFDAAREVFNKYPDLGVALDLEGNVKNFGIHAAGLVISTGPITDVCAVYQRKSKGEIVNAISFDKYDAEKKGLLKLDFLGLNTMTSIDHMRLEMGWSLDDLYNLPLEDELTLEGFRQNDIIGVFQFEGRACRYINGALKPDDFRDVYNVSALARPGPLHNGAANDYIDIKWGRKEPEHLHPALEPILSSTYGQIVYQEQILRILGEIGGFDWTHRAEVRRIISRKIGEQEFNRRWGMFRDGALRLHGATGMTEEIAKDIWGRCITAGSYAFNASHTVAYGMLSWDTMWFKKHEPDLFYQCVLNVSDKERQQLLLRDTQRFGRKIEIRPPHPKFSDARWCRTDGALQAGFSQIDGIGDKIAPEIKAYREQHSVEQWEDLLGVKGIGEKTVAKMREFAEQDDPFKAFWLDRTIAAVKAEIEAGKLGPIPRPTHVAEDLPYEEGEDIPVIWLGVIKTRNERDLFEFNQAKGGELDLSDPKHPKLNGKEIKDPQLGKWVVMVGDDESEQIGLRVDRWRYPRLRKKVWGIRPGKDLVLVKGVKPGWMPTRQITISDLWVIDPEG